MEKDLNIFFIRPSNSVREAPKENESQEITFQLKNQNTFRFFIPNLTHKNFKIRHELRLKCGHMTLKDHQIKYIT